MRNLLFSLSLFVLSAEANHSAGPSAKRADTTQTTFFEKVANQIQQQFSDEERKITEVRVSLPESPLPWLGQPIRNLPSFSANLIKWGMGESADMDYISIYETRLNLNGQPLNCLIKWYRKAERVEFLRCPGDIGRSFVHWIQNLRK